MSQRVVLYAEGPGDSGGDVRMLPAYGTALAEPHLGAAHHLVRRILAQNLDLDTAMRSRSFERFEKELRRCLLWL